MTNTESRGCLVRWRLSLSELTYMPRYMKGQANQVTEMMYQVPTAKWNQEEEEDFTDLPCFRLLRTSYTLK